MNAINHAATALLIKKRWPTVSLLPILISVQFIEIMWVIFNLVGIEKTELGTSVGSLADIHLSHMPYSHSVASTAFLAGAIWLLLAKGFNKPGWGMALAAGVSSHIILDLITHMPDISLAPGLAFPKLGTGLYAVPLAAFVLELAYGVWCWWFYQGSKTLLAVIVGLNLAALSFYSSVIPGPESLLAGHPQVFAAVIGVHILIGLTAIGLFAKGHQAASAVAS